MSFRWKAATTWLAMGSGTGAFPEVDLEADDPEAKISRKPP